MKCKTYNKDKFYIFHYIASISIFGLIHVFALIKIVADTKTLVKVVKQGHYNLCILRLDIF